MSRRIGASTGCCTERPILPVLDALDASGIGGIEIGTPPRHFDPWKIADVEAVHARLATAHVQAVAIHAPFGGSLELSDPDPRRARAGIASILMAARVLRQLGGSIVVVHATDVPRADVDVEQRLATCVASLRELDSDCRRLHMTLAIESPLPHLVGGSPDEFRWILDRVDPDTRVCLDTSHTTLGGNWDRFVDLVGDRLVHVHANDHRGQFDDHLPPGEGIVDWTRIGDDLRRVRYDGWIMLELRCPGDPLAEHFRAARARLTELLGR